MRIVSHVLLHKVRRLTRLCQRDLLIHQTQAPAVCTSEPLNLNSKSLLMLIYYIIFTVLINAYFQL